MKQVDIEDLIQDDQMKGLIGDCRAAMKQSGQPTGFCGEKWIRTGVPLIGVSDIVLQRPEGCKCDDWIWCCQPPAPCDNYVPEYGEDGDPCKHCEHSKTCHACEVCNGSGAIASASRCPECNP
jgi:hypothetical protein